MNGIQKSPRINNRPSALFAVALLLASFAALSGCASVPPSPSLAKQQTETLAKLGFEPVADGWQLTLPERISFEFNKSDLTATVRSAISEAAHQLLAVNIHQLRVEGHTDNIGAREYNQELSLRRANSVAAVLVTEGFAKENVDSQGYGAKQPAADNATEEGRAQNRRVEIIVTSNALATP